MHTAILAAITALCHPPIILPPMGRLPATNRGKPAVECVIELAKNGTDPFSQAFGEIVIKNNTRHTFRLMSRSTAGDAEFIDIEVVGSDGKRLSIPFYEAAIASYFERESLVATIEPGKPYKYSLLPFYGVDDEKLKPGKYKCRARFKWNGYDVYSKFIEVELTEQQIKDELKKRR